MNIAEFDVVLAEAEKKLAGKKKAAAYLLSLFEDSSSPLTELPQEEIDRLYKEADGWIPHFLKRRGLIGDKDAWQEASLALTKAVQRLNLGKSKGEQTEYIKKCVDNSLKNYFDHLRRKGMGIGKGYSDEELAKDVRPSMFSGNTTLKSNDGSDSRDTVFDTIASDERAPGESSDDADRAEVSRNVQDIIDDIPDPELKKLLKMMVNPKYHNSKYSEVKSGVNYGLIAKDWHKDNPKATPEERANGIARASVNAKVAKYRNDMMSYFRGLNESRVDPLQVYLSEQAAISEGKAIQVGPDGRIKDERAYGMTVDEFLEDFLRHGFELFADVVARDVKLKGMSLDAAFKSQLSSFNPVAHGLEIKNLPAKYLAGLKRRTKEALENPNEFG